LVLKVRVAWSSVRPPDALAAAYLLLLLAHKSTPSVLCEALASSTSAPTAGCSAEAVNAERNALTLVRLALAELRRILALLAESCGLEAVATRAPPYAVLAAVRYLLAVPFPEYAFARVVPTLSCRKLILMHKLLFLI
jgi:hypothetical protein